MKQIYFAIGNVFKERNYFLTFVLIAMIFFGLFIYIPVVTIPGNDIGFQLSIYSPQNYALMAGLALLVGLSFALQIYIIRSQKKHRDSAQVAGRLAVSSFSGIFGAIVGTAACASCLAFFFALLGLGTGSLFFVLENQSYFLVAAIGALLVNLYFIARKVNGVCEACRVGKKGKITYGKL